MGKYARDAGIIFGLSFLSGFIIGFVEAFAGFDPKVLQFCYAIGNVIFGIVGFAIVGAMAKFQRFKYMTKIVFVVWCLGLVNLLLGSPMISWLKSLPLLFLLMAIGGGLSLLFVPEPKAAGACANEG